MARPKKAANDRLTAFIPPTRCTESDKAIIVARAKKAGLPVSAFVRMMAMNGKVIVKESKTDFALIYELRKIGNNLNQLTHLAHSTGKFSNELETVYHRLNDFLDEAINSLNE